MLGKKNPYNTEIPALAGLQKLSTEEITFKTTNEMAKEMIRDVIRSQLFEVQCVGCDASFGSGHTFLDNLPESMYYFAPVRENEHIFRRMPQVV